MVQATRHVIGHDIPGAIVECGVWRGGSSMAAMLTALDLGSTDREFWLYDTYEGMTPPTEKDRKAFSGVHAEAAMAEVPKTARPQHLVHRRPRRREVERRDHRAIPPISCTS